MKFFSVTDDVPVFSQARTPNQTIAPVFSFVGALKEGSSAEWSPPFPMRLISGYVKSATSSSQQSSFAVMKRQDPDMNQDELFGRLYIEPNKLKGIIYFDNELLPKVVTPNEGLYVVSFNATGLRGTHIQLYGERLQN